MDYFEHSLDNFFQNLCLFADDVLCNLLPERQNALQPIQECRWHLIVFVLFLQELNSTSSISSASDTRAAITNLKRDTGKTKYSLCDRIQLEGVNLSLVSIWEN